MGIVILSRLVSRERIISNPGHAVGNVNAGQARAVLDRCPYRCHTAGNVNAGQACAVIECSVPNRSYRQTVVNAGDV